VLRTPFFLVGQGQGLGVFDDRHEAGNHLLNAAAASFVVVVVVVVVIDDVVVVAVVVDVVDFFGGNLLKINLLIVQSGDMLTEDKRAVAANFT
jgi:hypothetical protein